MTLGTDEHNEKVAGWTTKWASTMWALRIFTLAAFVTNIVFNYLGMQGYFGETNSEVSAKYPTLLTPAGYAFGIWGVIFSLQMIYAVYAVLPGDDDKLPYVALLSVFVPFGWLGEALWTVIFNQQIIPVSVVFITGSCLLFMTAYLRVTASLAITETTLDLFAGKAGSAGLLLKKVFYYFIFNAPTALNFGWLVVASIANGLIVLKYLQVDVPVAAAIGLLVFANVIAVFFLAWRREVVVSLVQLWAIPAIAANQTDTTLTSACWASTAVLAVLVGITFIANVVTASREPARSTRNSNSAGYHMTDIYYQAQY